MFPIGDSPNPKGLAPITIALIAINVIVYVLLMPQMSQAADPKDPRFAEYVQVIQQEGGQAGGGAEVDPRAYVGRVSEYDLTVFEHGSRPAEWTWLSMLTSMFLHGGLMHLLGNMLFLWIYGNNVEHRLGRLWYLVAYLATGFVASFGDIALRPDSNIPGVGASGAISGVLGMYFIWFPRNQVKLLLLLPPVVRQIDIGARWVLGFYIIGQNIIPAFVGGGGGGGIAYGAHIGGFIGGVLAAVVANLGLKAWPGRKGGPKEPPKPEDISAARAGPGGLSGELRRQLREGRVSDASRLFFGADEAQSDPDDAAMEDVLQLGAALEAQGEARGALAVYERGIARHPQGEALAAAHLGAARVLAGALRQPTMAYQHVVEAVRAGPSAEQVNEAQAILGEIRPQVRTLPNQLH